MAFDFDRNDAGTPPRSGAPFPPSSAGSGFQNPPAGPVQRPAGSANRPAGFRDQPVRSPAPPAHSGSPRPSDSGIPPRASRPPVRPAIRGGLPDIPWGRILPVLTVIVLLILCVIFREAIMQFLTELLTWAIMLLAVFLILKYIIFGGRR